MFDPIKIKKEFPLLLQKFKGKPYTYLDNAATSQKPKTVINALKEYYEKYNSNTHRGMHHLAEKATEAYEDARKAIQKFINAQATQEIIFTKNATEAINLIAYTWGEKNIKENDEILVSLMEHHSNFVPWQVLAKKKKATLRIIDITEDFTLDYDNLKKTLSKKTKIVAISAISNVTGAINDLEKISKIIRKNSSALFLVDAAQSIGHMKTDVQKIDCDFLAFSGHKMLAPTGVGILYGKKSILENIPPFQYGGNMIDKVETKNSTFEALPFKFEAGTQDIASIIALKPAIEFLEALGMENILSHDQELLKYAKEIFSKFTSIKFFCPKDTKNSSGILSFTYPNIHPHDIASIFDSEEIAIRSGLHCAEPLITHFNEPATARMSFYAYNTKEDIDRAAYAMEKTIKIFS